MLTKVKTKAWKKVVVMGISLSLGGFVPFMAPGYAFADENPEMVDIIQSDVYQNEVNENQIMENESSDGLEKINFEDTNRENSTKNDEISLVESEEDQTYEDTASDTSDEVTEDSEETNDEIKNEIDTGSEIDEESESNIDEETDPEVTDEIDEAPSQEDDEEFLIPEDDVEEVETDDQDPDLIAAEDSSEATDKEEETVDADIDTESVTEETEPADTNITDTEDDTYIIEEKTTDEMSENLSETEDEEFIIPEDEGEDEDVMMAAEADDIEADVESEETVNVESDEDGTEADETETYVETEGEYDISAMDTTEDTQEDPVITEEPSIEEQFPESYQPLLYNLLENHPEWKMEAANTEIDWETALDAEDEGSTNLISPSAPKAQKEKSNRKYDGSWDLANRETIAYYMDPRNFLNEDGIYQFLDQSYDPDSQNVDTVAAVIKDSFMEDGDPEGGYETFAACIDDVGAETDVNPNVLAAMIIEEQGWKGSSLSSGKKEGYEGYYNYMNVGAWTTDDMSSSERGLWYAKGEGKNKKSYDRPWDSPAKAIKGGAEVYSENYIENKQDTYYTKKFNVMNGEEAVGTHQYMTNVQAAADEGSLVKRAYEKSKELPAVFKIPVFENMPEEICALPGK